jgi:hypothetical protein
MEKLPLTPIYGWGWHNDKGSIELPEPFTLTVHAIEPGTASTVPRRAIGQIESANHQYTGMWAYLTLRTSGRLATYNVWIFSEEQTFGSVTPSTAAVTGFAELH